MTPNMWRWLTQCWFGHKWELRMTIKYGIGRARLTYVCEKCLATKEVDL